MKTKILLIFIILLGLSTTIFPQSLFRSGIFLHHSTGMTIWGPNGSSTSIPNEMVLYNTQKGYTGTNAVSMTETWFPAGNDNEWVTWHNLFDDSNSSIQPYLQNNKIIVIKTCFLFSAYMTGVGSPADTLNPALKTIYNYKWHWRSIIRVMQQHPENFFVIWTNAPLVPSATNSQQASLVNQFCTWAKDTLAEGNDPIFGSFPHNVYIFDFFHKLADENGMLRLEYATSTTDSHPNGTATELVAPQFVQEIFDAAIFYEENPLPVELSSFSASTIGSTVKLGWRTETEVNNYGFDVERSETQDGRSETWKKIGFVNGNGNSNSPKDYSFEDNAVNSGRYSYRLKQIDNDGQFEYSKTIEVDLGAPNKFELSQNYPNPFNPVTKIKFTIPNVTLSTSSRAESRDEGSRVQLKVFDVLGNEVSALVNGYLEAGTYEIDYNASELSSGFYIYKLESGLFVQTRKMMLLK